MIKTRSIQLKKEKNDGIRICIMRRIKPSFKFDIWIKELSPTTKLLKDYHNKRLDWDKFEKEYKKQILKSKKK
jgi:uncharacterized protein YeaO (DUF488 family)